MPKVHRGSSTGLLRSHSRNSSTAKLGATLQFTQKDQPLPKVLDKPKKTGYGHDSTQAHGKGVARVTSPHRVHSRDQVQPLVPKRAPAHQTTTTTTAKHTAKPKPGFTISSLGEGEDEDEWISSGAATPSNHHSDSETESDDHTPDAEFVRRLGGRHPQQQQQQQTLGAMSQTPVPVLPRVETARPSDFGSAAVKPVQPKTERSVPRPGTRTPTIPPIKTEPIPNIQRNTAQNHRPLERAMADESRIAEAPSSPRKRQSSTRPPSSHSIRLDQPLRPHPLIRGHSYGQVIPTKPVPLEPLTVIPDMSMTTSPPSYGQDDQLSTSPSSSIRTTTTTSRCSPDRGSSSHNRRTSVSSARSVATLPTHHSLRDSVNWSLGDRRRTLSTISHSSSSAALSALAHLPTVTRPPSPQSVSFFPPVNPHANIEGIHPLLPGPYLNNHLTVLARRTPIKESFDRVTRAKLLIG